MCHRTLLRMSHRRFSRCETLQIRGESEELDVGIVCLFCFQRIGLLASFIVSQHISFDDGWCFTCISMLGYKEVSNQ